MKAKIQRRPNREDLERRHILEEDESHIDPSLAEKQRMLKKARLADQLNIQIQHRPGPLELIKKNILHTEESIEQIVKDGLVTFKATSEGFVSHPSHPNHYLTIEDDSLSSSSDAGHTPSMGESSSPSISDQMDVLQVAVNLAGVDMDEMPIFPIRLPPNVSQPMVTTTVTIISTNVSTPTTATVALPLSTSNALSKYTARIAAMRAAGLAAGRSGGVGIHTVYNNKKQMNSVNMVPSPPSSLCSTVPTLSPFSSIASSSQSVISRQILSKNDTFGKEKNRKKLKSRPTLKTRTIKFHEYKGPPNATQKNCDVSLSSLPTTAEETSYQLMLEQQNCLLKFLENLNKNKSILTSTNNSIIPSTSSATSIATMSGIISKTNKVMVENTIATTNSYVSAIKSAQSSPIMYSTVMTMNNNPVCPAANIMTPLVTTNDSPNNNSNNSIDHLVNNNPSSAIETDPTAQSYSEFPIESGENTSVEQLTQCNSPLRSNVPFTTIDKIDQLEKLKVADLKTLLKMKNLPVSGKKSQLIDRLKDYLPFTESDLAIINFRMSPLPMDQSGENNILMALSPKPSGSKFSKLSPNSSPLVNELDRMPKELEHEQCSNNNQELAKTSEETATTIDIIKYNELRLQEQQNKINLLQHQLMLSQEELREIRNKHSIQERQKFNNSLTSETAVKSERKSDPNNTSRSKSKSKNQSALDYTLHSQRETSIQKEKLLQTNCPIQNLYAVQQALKKNALTTVEQGQHMIQAAKVLQNANVIKNSVMQLQSVTSQSSLNCGSTITAIRNNTKQISLKPSLKTINNTLKSMTGNNVKVNASTMDGTSAKVNATAITISYANARTEGNVIQSTIATSPQKLMLKQHIVSRMKNQRSAIAMPVTLTTQSGTATKLARAVINTQANVTPSSNGVPVSVNGKTVYVSSIRPVSINPTQIIIPAATSLLLPTNTSTQNTSGGIPVLTQNNLAGSCKVLNQTPNPQALPKIGLLQIVTSINKTLITETATNVVISKMPPTQTSVGTTSTFVPTMILNKGKDQQQQLQQGNALNLQNTVINLPSGNKLLSLKSGNQTYMWELNNGNIIAQTVNDQNSGSSHALNGGGCKTSTPLSVNAPTNNFITTGVVGTTPNVSKVYDIIKTVVPKTVGERQIETKCANSSNVMGQKTNATKITQNHKYTESNNVSLHQGLLHLIQTRHQEAEKQHQLLHQQQLQAGQKLQSFMNIPVRKVSNTKNAHVKSNEINANNRHCVNTKAVLKTITETKQTLYKVSTAM